MLTIRKDFTQRADQVLDILKPDMPHRRYLEDFIRERTFSAVNDEISCSERFTQFGKAYAGGKHD